MEGEEEGVGNETQEILFCSTTSIAGVGVGGGTSEYTFGCVFNLTTSVSQNFPFSCCCSCMSRTSDVAKERQVVPSESVVGPSSCRRFGDKVRTVGRTDDRSPFTVHPWGSL